MHPSYFYGRGRENRAEIAVPLEKSEDELVESDEDNEVGVKLDESRESSESETDTDTEPEEAGRGTRQFIIRSVCMFV